MAEASGNTAAADAMRRGVELQSPQKQLRLWASSGNLAAVKAVLGMAGLNVDAADAVSVSVSVCAREGVHLHSC